LKGYFLSHLQVNVNIFHKDYKKAAENMPSCHSCTIDSIMEHTMDEQQQENKENHFAFLHVSLLFTLFQNLIQWFLPSMMTIKQNNQCNGLFFYSGQCATRRLR
jgi:hypothetical protein